jgi:parallel beta-helix repeat protein
LVWCVLVGAAGESRGGELTPPVGPVSPTPGPEPRIAINATNTPGDAGSTFIITQRGSYYLTGNITGEVGKNGIRVAAQSVTIDLNGFSLIGVAGSLSGLTTDPAATQVVVVNGLVRDWDGAGLVLRSRSRAEDLSVWSSGLNGIIVGDDGRVERCQSLANGVAGVLATTNALIAGCQALRNGTDGIVAGFGASVMDCSASNNTDFGIQLTNVHGRVERCIAALNGNMGIITVDSTTVRGCTANENGGDGISVGFDSRVEQCLATLNTFDGIEAGSRSTVTGNTCTSNGNGGTGSGVHLGLGIVDCVIDGNRVSANDRGIEVDGTGNLILNNTAASNTTNNYEIAANNRYGQIVDITAAGAAAANGNAAASTLTTSAPHANFAY